MKKMTGQLQGGVWSAAPTPWTLKGDLDRESIKRMVDHHLALDVKGLFLAGTNGEGPWMTARQRRGLVHDVVARVRGRIPIAVQVTDNSAARILENMREVREDGADVAVIAPPFFMYNVTPAHVLSLYLEAIRSSPLPVGIYDRGRSGAVFVPDAVMKALCLESKVVMLKDSSVSPERMRQALAVKRQRSGLILLNGNEFDCVSYLRAGYDGLLLGGGVFNGILARHIVDAMQQGDIKTAEQVQKRMNQLMWTVYGGKRIRFWLAGEKQLLKDMGVFSTTVNYPRYEVGAAGQRAIQRVLAKNRSVLLPT